MQLMLKVFALAQISLLVALFPAAHALHRDEFPPEFVFGASTSAYQVLLSFSSLINHSFFHFVVLPTLFVSVYDYVLNHICIYERLKVQRMKMAGSQAFGILSLMLYLVSILCSHISWHQFFFPVFNAVILFKQ